MAVKAKTNVAPAKTTRASKLKTTQIAAKNISRTSGKEAANAGVAKPVKADKPRKQKMVRDSFTMPESDYAQIAELKKKCLQAGVHVKKSELLRAGLALLSKLQDTALLKTIGQVERIKTGRPAKN